MTKKLRLSYSLLSYWSRGKVDEAISLYFHLQTPTNKAMENGKNIHKKMSDYLNLTKKFPDWLIPFELKNPKSEHELVVDYNEIFTLKAIIDVLDIPTIYELKTGGTDSLEWSREKQIPFYFLVCELAGIPVDKAILLRFNGQETDYTQIWNHRVKINEAQNLIDSLGPEIYEHFQKNGLI